MSVNKKILGLVLAIVASSMLTAIPVNANCDDFGPTSLEIWKTIECKSICGDWVTISGWIYIKNDPNYDAKILHIMDYVEAKYKNNPWTNLATVTISDPYIVVQEGATHKVWYSITFQKDDMYTAYRNVARVHLENHPTGDKWYTYRLSFDIPM